MPTGSAMAGAKDGSSLRDRVPTYDLLGVRGDGLTVQTLYAAIAEAIDAPGTTVIGNHNLHSIYLYNRDPKNAELLCPYPVRLHRRNAAGPGRAPVGIPAAGRA